MEEKLVYNYLHKTIQHCFISLVSEGTVRLYHNGATLSSYYYGIVQVYLNSEWGNICFDYNYGLYEADVICHQLGYTGASSYSRAGFSLLDIVYYYT